MGSRTLLAAMIIAVAAAVAAGFAVVGSPAIQREHRLDDKRIEDLADLQLAVGTYRDGHNGLPKSLDELGGPARVRDPLTSQPYEYLVLGDDRFQLCATFQQRSNERAGFWHHDAGRYCFIMAARQKQVR